jgi:hypothetical protein
MHNSICAVIVTYGDRFHLLKQVIDACFREGVNKVIVVDNASVENNRNQLKEFEKENSDKLKVIYLNENTGSTGLSNRRALMLVIIFSPFLIGIFSVFIKAKNLKRNLLFLIFYMFIFLLIIIIIINHLYYINMNDYIEYIKQAIYFSHTRDPSTLARINQFYSLINGWEKSPLIGHGFGAVASVIRNNEQPWSYELSYVALLFHIGIIGILFYFLLTFWIIFNGIKLSKNNYERKYILPYLIGMICFLIGNASNPYLMKFDYLWVIFIPVMYINSYYLSKGQQKYEKIRHNNS